MSTKRATAKEFEPLLNRVLEGIQKHGKFVIPAGYYPRFGVSQFGWKIEVGVKLLGSRKRASEICGDGDTADQAVDKLLESLDLWTQVW